MNSNRYLNHRFRQPMMLGLLLAMACMSPMADGFQDAESQIKKNQINSGQVEKNLAEKSHSILMKDKSKWEPEAIQEFRFSRDGQVQTFRIQRSEGKPGGPGQPTTGFRFHQDGNHAIQIESMPHRMSLPGMNALEIFTQHLAGRTRGQIVVEMKKTVGEDQQPRSVVYFAPDSWIETRNGQVDLFAEKQNGSAKNIKKYWIGVRCREIQTKTSPGNSNGESIQVQTRLRVDDVVPQSAAEKAGIRVRDELVSWNAQPLVSITNLVSTVQNNRQQPAKVEVLREGQTLEVEITPDVKSVQNLSARTLIVPTAKLQVAKQKIKELKELVARVDRGNEEVRVLLVGPGVNFGQKDIELQIDPQVLVQKTKLKKILDQVAEKKFGVFIKENSLAFNGSPEKPEVEVIEDLDIEPHEIWETMQLGVNGKTFGFNQLAPKIIEQHRVEIRIAEKAIGAQMKKLAKQLKTGQIVFPNPLNSVRDELKKEIRVLHLENEKMREENRQLKEALQKLKDQLRD